MRWRVQQGLSALSSDGLSNFGIPEDNAAALDAIRHYFDQYIPMVVAEQLLQSESKWSEAQSGGTLTVTLHKHGVNLRHLGRVFNLVAESAAGAEIKAALRSVLLNEMTRRSLKVLMLQARRSQGNDETVDLCQSITIDQVLSTLTLKYPDLILTDSDRQYITHTVLVVGPVTRCTERRDGRCRIQDNSKARANHAATGSFRVDTGCCQSKRALIVNQ